MKKYTNYILWFFFLVPVSVSKFCCCWSFSHCSLLMLPENERHLIKQIPIPCTCRGDPDSYSFCTVGTSLCLHPELHSRGPPSTVFWSKFSSQFNMQVYAVLTIFLELHRTSNKILSYKRYAQNQTTFNSARIIKTKKGTLIYRCIIELQEKVHWSNRKNKSQRQKKPSKPCFHHQTSSYNITIRPIEL